MALRTLSVCAGIGGIDLALRRRARTVCYVEREPFAVAVLTSRMRGGELDAAPVWDDLRTFDGRPWRGCVDLIAGGIPCQPNSLAGKRRGGADDRDLWPDFRRVVREVGPRFAFVENVPGLLSVDDGRSFGRILGDLAEDGYDAAWCCLPAADVGARHRRDRVFILGWLADSGRIGRERPRVAPVMGGAPGPRASEGAQRQRIRHAVDDRGAALAHSHGHGRESERSGRLPDRDEACGHDADRRCERDVGDANRARREGADAASRLEQDGAVDSGHARHPHTHSTQPRVGCLSDGLRAWLAVAGPREPQHAWEPPRVVAGSVPNRSAHLRALGNAVVSAQVEAAFEHLYAIALESMRPT